MKRIKANSERVKQLKQAIQKRVCSNDRKYSYDAFCTMHGLYHGGREEKAGGIWITCPFHKDEAPSLSFSPRKGIWHCFGCDLGGNYLDFVYLYETEVEGKKFSHEVFMDAVLKDDYALQAELGFGSVIQKEAWGLESFSPIQRKRFQRKEVYSESYVELQEKLEKTNPSLEKKLLLLLFMQNGIPVKDAEKELLSGGST